MIISTKIKQRHQTILLAAFLFVITATQSCNQATKETDSVTPGDTLAKADVPEYFNLRPALEKQYGYTHAVKIGSDLKISGAVSMTDSGVVIGPGNMEVQMKNCYNDLEKILQHYGYTFDDVYAENIYTTNMAAFEKAAGFRNTIYKKQFPTGTWLEVKGLALVNQVIEIDMEAHK
jgi:enamine deaminase RidA (YjgF/YER057c/UK114 family)